jgi:hypothetical protein
MARRGHADQEPTHCGFNVLSGNEDAQDAIGVICGLHSGLHFYQTTIYQHFISVKSGAGGSRTPVQTRTYRDFYMLIL